MQINDFQTISLLFSEKNQYKIPRYQRRYVWNMINWEALWQDIIQLTRDQDDTHFAGTIMTYQEKEMVTEIIDGQQRLTTFQIILCVIRDLWESKEYEDNLNAEDKDEIEGKLGSLTKMGSIGTDNSYPFRLKPSSLDEEAFRSVVSQSLWSSTINNSDTTVLEAFDSLFEKGFNENGKQSEQHLIVTAYGYFGKEIVGYLENGCLSELAYLFSVFTSRSNVIKVTIESNDMYDPERIFQTINDTGRMLTDFDYLRNYLFLRTRKRLGAEPSDKLYGQHWDRFEKWDDGKLEQFFQAYLKAKLGPGCLKDKNMDIKPFDCYRKHINTLEGPDDNFFIPLLELSRYANSYDELSNSDEIDEDPQKLSNQMRFYDYLELPRLDWFLLFMQHAHESSDSELLQSDMSESSVSEILDKLTMSREENSKVLSSEGLNELCEILESYIVRRWLCDETYESSYKYIISFFDEQSKDEHEVQEFVNYLSTHWPDPKGIEDVLRENADSVAPNLILYILYRIEPLPSSTGPTLFNFGDKKINKLVEPADIYWELLAEVDEGKSNYNRNQLESEAKKIANSIGNITSEATKSTVDWNKEKIVQRTNRLLESFNGMWKPKAEDLKS